MIKTIMRNKFQALLTVLVNLCLYFIVIYIINIQYHRLKDFNLFMILVLTGIIFMTIYYKVFYSLKTKVLQVRFAVIYYLILVILLGSFSLIFNFNFEDYSKTIIVGLAITIYVYNTADTIHNLRIKSGLILQDLEK